MKAPRKNGDVRAEDALGRDDTEGNTPRLTQPQEAGDKAVACWQQCG